MAERGCKHFVLWISYCTKFPDLSYEILSFKEQVFLEIRGNQTGLILTNSSINTLNNSHVRTVSFPLRPHVVVDQNGLAVLYVFDKVIEICTNPENGSDFVKKLSSAGGYKFCRRFSNEVITSKSDDLSSERWRKSPCILWFKMKPRQNNDLCINCQKCDDFHRSKEKDERLFEIISVNPKNYSPSSYFRKRALKCSDDNVQKIETRNLKNSSQVYATTSDDFDQCEDEWLETNQRNSKRKRSSSPVPSDTKKRMNEKSLRSIEGKVSHNEFKKLPSTFESLIWPKDVTEFFQNNWEKAPLVLHRNNASFSDKVKSLSKLFTKDMLVKLIANQNIKYGRDVNCCRYKDGVRENLNKNGTMTVTEFSLLFNKMQSTVQFHQPQRYVKELWKLMEKLESYFGCLVGANVYITPQGSQGLAPHYDDVEVFIVQIEGEKHWRLYKPPVELPFDYSPDLSEDQIGSPTHDFVLKPGDLLYMPRGTIHQANTPQNSSQHSTHITISTYQKHTWGDYLSTVMDTLMENAMQSSVLWRQGLPLGFLFNQQPSKDTMFQLFSTLANLEPVHSHLLLKDFMASRLPPFSMKKSADVQEKHSENPFPTLSSQVKLQHPKHVSFAIVKSEDNEEDESEVSDENEHYVVLYTSISNKRKCHMMPTSSAKLEGLKFPVHYAKALQQLKENCDAFTQVSKLDLPSDEEKLKLSISLWSMNLLTVLD